MMWPSSNPQPPTLQGYVVTVSRCDRWQLYHRLQELQIPSVCCPDGSLRADIPHGLALVLLRSAVQQLTAPRAELVDWLNRCWIFPSPPRNDLFP